MANSFRKIGFAARLALLLAVVLGTFAVSASSVSARKIMPATVTAGNLEVHVYDRDSISQGPLAAAAVSIFDISGGLVMNGSTDKGGVFRVELEEGTYSVIAAATGYTQNKVYVSVKSGTDTATKMGLSKNSMVVQGVLTVRTWQNTDRMPVPLAGVAVMVLNASGDPAATGYTNKQGMFSAKLDAGAYKIEAMAEGYKPSKSEGIVKSNEQTTTDIALVKEVVTDQMTLYVYDGSVVHFTPLAGASLTVSTLDGLYVTKGATDGNGMYNTSLSAGMYMIDVSAIGYQSAQVVVKVYPGRPYVGTVMLTKEPAK
jgi:hypothetical protein